ncbi:hypothetical protein Naga_100002g29 [Nannochloropsis gaditana]|uniref:Uncharacterized protein n=1 Tax=Nannochloropsis gaditana TaxID=72520 RepID=W7TZ49_9STRA|nr:hypothetical protein Naga_100002g29 [Nannochloropsis gaditana]
MHLHTERLRRWQEQLCVVQLSGCSLTFRLGNVKKGVGLANISTIDFRALCWHLNSPLSIHVTAPGRRFVLHPQACAQWNKVVLVLLSVSVDVRKLA